MNGSCVEVADSCADPNSSCVGGTCECNSGYFNAGGTCSLRKQIILITRFCNGARNMLSPSYTVTGLATTELRLTPIYQVVMHRQES